MEIIFETADCEKVQATTVIYARKAYLKINSLVKTPLHEFMAVVRSGLWAPDDDISVWEPTQKFVFLETVLDFEKGLILIREGRILKLKSALVSRLQKVQ